jgi:tRNA/rRNA methyltransferase
MLVRIPTDRFASLNVAQAVLVMCYELRKEAAPDMGSAPAARGATVEALERMYAHLEETLLRLCVIPASNPQRGMMKVRRFLSRVRLRSHEVQMIRGLCRQIEWYAEKRARDGVEENGRK